MRQRCRDCSFQHGPPHRLYYMANEVRIARIPAILFLP